MYKILRLLIVIIRINQIMKLTIIPIIFMTNPPKRSYLTSSVIPYIRLHTLLISKYAVPSLQYRVSILPRELEWAPIP